MKHFKLFLLLNLFVSFSILAQTKTVSIHYKGKDYVVGHDIVCFIVKEGYYNDELLKQFEKENYEIALTLPKFRYVFLRTDGKSDILEHYYKFDKEEYVEEVVPYVVVDWGILDPPIGYSLGNYPNPFNTTTIIQYSIPKDEYVKLVVYDVTGKVVKELVNGQHQLGAGIYNIAFNASGYASGTYYYKIEAGEYKSTQKMVLIK